MNSITKRQWDLLELQQEWERAVERAAQAPSSVPKADDARWKVAAGLSIKSRHHAGIVNGQGHTYNSPNPCG